MSTMLAILAPLPLRVRAMVIGASRPFRASGGAKITIGIWRSGNVKILGRFPLRCFAIRFHQTRWLQHQVSGLLCGGVVGKPGDRQKSKG